MSGGLATQSAARRQIYLTGPSVELAGDPSKFMAALWEVRQLCTRAEHVRLKVPGRDILVQAIMSAIDDYAENETGNREYFWNRPHSAG
jgi:hypothetical protein